MKKTLALVALTMAAAANPQTLQSLPTLDVARYTGTWYQVLWVPNRFQRQCVSDTRATYRDRGDGTIEVDNQCRQADGTLDRVVGVARPASGARIDSSGTLAPAQLKVSFLPAWLRWIGIGWGDYWVVELGPQGRYSVVSEPSREYLWVLAREPVLTPADAEQIRIRLQALGFDLARVQPHPQPGR